MFFCRHFWRTSSNADEITLNQQQSSRIIHTMPIIFIALLSQHRNDKPHGRRFHGHIYTSCCHLLLNRADVLLVRK